MGIRRHGSIASKVGTALAAILAVCVVTSASAQAAAATSPATIFHRAAVLTGPVTTGQVIEPISAQTPDLAANGYVEQEFFRRRDGDRVQGRHPAERREVDDHADDVGSVQDQDPGATTKGPDPFQRDGRGRVAQRDER